MPSGEVMSTADPWGFDIDYVHKENHARFIFLSIKIPLNLMP